MAAADKGKRSKKLTDNRLAFTTGMMESDLVESADRLSIGIMAIDSLS